MKYDRFTPSSIVLSNMIEIYFTDNAEDGFRKVKETLERIGIASRQDDKKLFQTAHILHKQGKYYICHFKEMFALDGKTAELSESDLARRNLIFSYLVDWDMVTPVSSQVLHPVGNPSMVKVLKHSEKEDWEIIKKYSIGTKKGVEHAVV